MVVVAAALLAATVGGLLRLEIDTSPAAFLPKDDSAVTDATATARQFGGDAIVVLLRSAQPAELLDGDQLTKLIQLEGRLAQLPDVAAVFGPGTSLNQLAGASQHLLARIAGERDGLMAAAEQKARAAGGDETRVRQAREQAVAQFDIRYGSLLARGLPAGLPTLKNAHFVRNVVFDGAGQIRAQWRFMVPAPDTVVVSVRPREDIDQPATERLVGAVRRAIGDAALPTVEVTVSGAPALAAALGQQVRTEFPYIGLLALVLIGGCYLLIPWTRRRRDRLMPLACTLVATALVLAAFGWLDHPLSLGVVAFLPILVGIGSDFPAYLAKGTSPRRVAVAAAASAAGFAALAVSPLPFVRDLGLALAAGLLVALAVAAGATRLGFRDGATAGDEVIAPSPATPAAPPERTASTGTRLALLGAAGAVALTGWILLPHLKLQAQPDRLAEGLPAVSDVRRIEQTLGSSGEIQAVLQGPDVLTPAALSWMRTTEQAAVLAHGDKLEPIASLPDLLDFLGPAPDQQQIDGGMATLPPYLTGAVVSLDYRAAVIRLGLRLQDLTEQQRLLDSLAGSLPPPPPGYETKIVGLPVAAAQANTMLSEDRYLSNSLGIVLAGLVLLVGLRGSRPLAGRAVLAALLATGWGLAATWLAGVPLTPLTVALGSLSTATACEFTILLSDARERNTSSRIVGVAALAASLGYLALTASRLAVLRDFGLLLAAAVVLSLLAAHLVVRALPRAVTTTRASPRGSLSRVRNTVTPRSRVTEEATS